MKPSVTHFVRHLLENEEPTTSQVPQIAQAFVRKLREYLSPEQWAEMAQLNREESNPDICHSHDFCDSNVFIADAFEEVMGREVDLQSEADVDLLNAAWDHAKAALAEDDEPTGTV